MVGLRVRRSRINNLKETSLIGHFTISTEKNLFEFGLWYSTFLYLRSTIYLNQYIPNVFKCS